MATLITLGPLDSFVEYNGHCNDQTFNFSGLRSKQHSILFFKLFAPFTVIVTFEAFEQNRKMLRKQIETYPRRFLINIFMALYFPVLLAFIIIIHNVSLNFKVQRTMN